MKTLLKIIFLMAVISLVPGCNKDEIFNYNANNLKSGIAPVMNKAQGLDEGSSAQLSVNKSV